MKLSKRLRKRIEQIKADIANGEKISRREIAKALEISPRTLYFLEKNEGLEFPKA